MLWAIKGSGEEETKGRKRKNGSLPDQTSERLPLPSVNACAHMFTSIFLFHQRTIPTGLGKHAVNGHGSHPDRKLRNMQQTPNLGSPCGPRFALGFRTASGCSWCPRKLPVAFGCPPRSVWGALEATLGTVPEPPRPGTSHGTTSHTLCPWRVPGHL